MAVEPNRPVGPRPWKPNKPGALTDSRSEPQKPAAKPKILLTDVDHSFTLREPCVASLRTDRLQIGLSDRHHRNPQSPFAYLENRSGLSARVIKDESLVHDPQYLACVCEAASVSAAYIRIGHVVPALGYPLADSLDAPLRVIQTNIEEPREE